MQQQHSVAAAAVAAVGGLCGRGGGGAAAAATGAAAAAALLHTGCSQQRSFSNMPVPRPPDGPNAIVEFELPAANRGPWRKATDKASGGRCVQHPPLCAPVGCWRRAPSSAQVPAPHPHPARAAATTTTRTRGCRHPWELRSQTRGCWSKKTTAASTSGTKQTVRLSVGSIGWLPVWMVAVSHSAPETAHNTLAPLDPTPNNTQPAQPPSTTTGTTTAIGEPLPGPEGRSALYNHHHQQQQQLPQSRRSAMFNLVTYPLAIGLGFGLFSGLLRLIF